jgi:transposase-like protein
MPRSYPPEVRRQVLELARAGTKVKQPAATFRMSDATIYTWLKHERIDRGEAEGATTSQQLELGAARKRIRQLETELAVARKVNEMFLAEGIAPKGSLRLRSCQTALFQAYIGSSSAGLDDSDASGEKLVLKAFSRARLLTVFSRVVGSTHFGPGNWRVLAAEVAHVSSGAIGPDWTGLDNRARRNQPTARRRLLDMVRAGERAWINLGDP